MSNEKTVMVQVLGDNAASLDGIAGPVVGKRFALSAGTFIIGREADADLSLPDDAGLSRVHAKIVADGEQYKIVDNDSRNGTLVNDKPVRSIHLFDGDIVRIGSSTLRFSQASARRPPEPTAIIHPDKLAPRAPPGPTAPIAAPRPPAIAPWVAAVAGAGALVLVLSAVVIGIFIGRSDAPPAPVAAAQPMKSEPAKSEPMKSEPVTSEPAKSEPAKSEPAPPAAPAAAAAESSMPWSAARFVGGVDEVVRLKQAGKVESVDVKDGDAVEKGAPLAVIVGVGASAADIATRKESIAALESVAESNQRAAKQLAEEKAELQKLLAQTAKIKVTSPSSGRVQQLVLAPGESVRSGQVIARIVGAPARIEVDVAASVAAALSAGAACELRPQGATDVATEVVKGTLREKREKGPDSVTLSIEPATPADAKSAVQARCSST